MARASISKIVSSIERIDADPNQVKQHLQQLHSILLSQSQHRGQTPGVEAGEREHAERERREHDERERLEKTLNGMRVVLSSGRATTWGKLIADLAKSIPVELLKAVSKENFYQMWPFRELGNVPIATSSAGAGAPGMLRVRDLYLPFGGSSQTQVPLVRPELHSHTITIYMHKEWWDIPLVLYRYSASTRVTADGLDAADLAGGAYAQAKTICETWVIPPDDPNGIVAFIKALACAYAESTPEMPLTVFQIMSEACPKCQITVSDGRCLPDCNSCSCDTGNWVSEWTSNYTGWGLGPPCFDVASVHEVWFNAPPNYPSQGPGHPDFEYVFC